MPRCCSAVLLLSTLVGPAASAQTRGGSSFAHGAWGFEVGVARSGLLANDENGIRVRATWAPTIAASGAWQVAPATRLAVSLRGASASVSVKDKYVHPAGDSAGASAEWSPGRSTLVDGIGAVERDVMNGGAMVHAGAGFVWLTGPSAVEPFRSGGGLHPAVEAGVAIEKPGGSSPFALVLTAQGYRLGGGRVSDPVQPGSVLRLLLGVRYGK